jgi:hypothetical protein
VETYLDFMVRQYGCYHRYEYLQPQWYDTYRRVHSRDKIEVGVDVASWLARKGDWSSCTFQQAFAATLNAQPTAASILGPRPARTDREELEILRVSLGRVAQAIGAQTDDKPVLDQSSFNELCELAKQDRGWNALAGLLCERAQYLKEELERLGDG